MALTYEQSGVNISEGNRAVELMKKSVQKTYRDGVVGDIGLFSGGFSLKAFKDMEDPILLASTDGVGTKILISQELGIHNTVGIDLVAMCVNDLICQGAQPLFFLDYIASGHLEAEKISQLVEGIAQGCLDSMCSLIGGETAEMPGLYGEDEYDLAGFSVGIVDRVKMIDGSKIKEGDSIIGLASSGIHSNGYSLVRRLFLEELGMKLTDPFKGTDQSLGQVLLTPTKLYVKAILNLLDQVDLKGIVNITGGGFVENIPRILPENLNARVHVNSWEKLPVFKAIEESGMVEFEEMYRSLNMGIGMVLICDPQDEEAVLKSLAESGEEAVKIGEIVQGNKVCELIK